MYCTTSSGTRAVCAVLYLLFTCDLIVEGFKKKVCKTETLYYCIATAGSIIMHLWMFWELVPFW